MTVDLAERTVEAGGYRTTFQIDDYVRWCLMEGLDDISLTLQNAEAIAAYEAATWMSALGCDVTMLVRGPRLLSAAESFASRLIESFTSEASYEGE